MSQSHGIRKSLTLSIQFLILIVLIGHEYDSHQSCANRIGWHPTNISSIHDNVHNIHINWIPYWLFLLVFFRNAVPNKLNYLFSLFLTEISESPTRMDSIPGPDVDRSHFSAAFIRSSRALCLCHWLRYGRWCAQHSDAGLDNRDVERSESSHSADPRPNFRNRNHIFTAHNQTIP